jgi:hypothetical protein
MTMPAKQLLTILFLLSTGFLFSQENTPKAPDYISIKKNISDKNSNLYYPVLLKKLAVNDTLITDVTDILCSRNIIRTVKHQKKKKS